MTPLAPHLTAFLQDHLPQTRRTSPHTVASYAYASAQLHVAPSQLHIEQLDAALLVRFLNHLESDRRNGPSSRNVRLAAVKSFMHYLEFRGPALLDHARQVLAIPAKKFDTRLVRHLTVPEMQAILDAPRPTTRAGLRDQAMLHLAFAAGLRVSELVSGRCADVSWQPHASLLVRGKGRRERSLPLWTITATALRAWLAVRGAPATIELFVNARGHQMTRAGFEYILAKHVTRAAVTCPSVAAKRVSPHVLRHTCAVTVLQATKDLRKVALWLGHAHVQTTEMYTRADPSVTLEALEAIVPPALRSGRFKATDALLAALASASVMRRPHGQQ